MVTIDFAGKLPKGLTAADVTRLAELTCKRVGVKGKVGIGVRVVTDAAIRKLNRIHRGKDKVTDVLSFSATEGLPAVLHAATKAGEPRELGDIIIALPRVTKQAKAIGREPAAEFALMIVHGTLHLLGYDHESLADENKMFGLQHDVLIKAGIF